MRDKMFLISDSVQEFVFVRKVLAKAWVKGFRFGWAQPADLGTGLTFEGPSENEAFDRGANWGQFLRAGRKSQAYREGYLPKRKGK